jgi:hypothetical protein
LLIEIPDGGANAACFLRRNYLIAANDNSPRRSLPALPPRGLCRGESAAYIGVSPTMFDLLVKDGRMPKPKRVNTRVIWDRLKLDFHFDAMDDDSAAENPWGRVA